MKYFLTLFLLIILSAGIFAAENEIRGIWINSDKMPKTDKEAIDLVKEYHNAGFNLLFPETVCRGYAVFPSKILKRDPRFENCGDTLKTMTEEAHRLGMQVHPWVWCFRAGYTNHPGAIITEHPDWLECSKYGDTLSVNGGMWISPIIPEVRKYLISIYSEIAKNYDIDGFHLDYVRYETQNPIPYGYSKTARQKWSAKHPGYDPARISYLGDQYLSWMLFREEYVSRFIKETNHALKKIKPNIILSAAVASDSIEARFCYMQNWKNWADNGWIDMIIPMTYMTDDTKFSAAMDLQLKEIDGKVWTAVGIGSHNFTKNESRNIDQIKLARKTEYMGVALFASQYMTETLENLLKTNTWQENVKTPFKDNSDKNTQINNFKNNITKEKLPIHPSKYLPNPIAPIPVYHAFRKQNPIKIDGIYRNSEWQYYPDLNINRTVTGETASVNTTVKMTYDNENIYLIYICHEPDMHLIKADTTKRDGPTFYDDSAEVFIQMLPSAAKYNHFSVNTKNVQFDQQIFNVSWNKNWESKVTKYYDRWIAEIKIPFKELSVSCPKKGDYYRMNFTRNRSVVTPQENFNWSVTYISFHTPERFGYIIFE
ncbi:MAG: family 10 glycosylhydrolase [Armatimonadetes bacterium]|nr:family 10 glycosylhydrolase [Candidatus Hippobium faecium]